MPTYANSPTIADPSTPYGRVRSLLADVDPAALVWTDDEINGALAYQQNNAELAAAWLLEGAATDAAKLALVTKTESTNTDLRAIGEQLAARAQQLRAIAIVPIVASVNAPAAPFTMGSADGSVVGSMDLW